MEVYAKLDQLPMGQADLRFIQHGCMVLEGGAWRGLYTQGVLDALMENDINLDCTIGVSAGAMSGLGYVSGQIGFSGRFNLTYRNDQNYCGWGAMRRDHGITGFSYAFHELFRKEGFAYMDFMNSPRRFVAVATDVDTGRPVYFEKGKCTDILKAVQASATVPYVSQPVEIEGRKYLDGGLGVKVPYEWALREGYEKIIVVRTRDRSYRKAVKKPLQINHIYRHEPRAMEDLIEEAPRYNILLDRLDMLEEKGRVLVIAPSRPITIRRFEDNMEKLGEVYWLGYEDGKKEADRVKVYVDMKK
jgi:predicted patatin/cPLA2 family phospholipase